MRLLTLLLWFRHVHILFVRGLRYHFLKICSLGLLPLAAAAAVALQVQALLVPRVRLRMMVMGAMTGRMQVDMGVVILVSQTFLVGMAVVVARLAGVRLAVLADLVEMVEMVEILDDMVEMVAMIVAVPAVFARAPLFL